LSLSPIQAVKSPGTFTVQDIETIVKDVVNVVLNRLAIV